MKENSNVKELLVEEDNLIKKSIIRMSLIIISTIILVLLVNLKKSVNNEITNIYYFISIVGTIISICLFILLFIKTIKNTYKQKIFGFLDLFYIFTVACACFQLFFSFGYFKANVDGTSMVPTFDNNQVLIVRSSNNNIDNFDVVVARYDKDVNNFSSGLNDGDLLVKRVIAKEGDTFYFLHGTLYLNGKAITEEYSTEYFGTFSLADSAFATTEAIRYDENEKCYYINDGYYFLMGDNRIVSNDSRQLGLFKKEQIVGRVDYELHGVFDWERVK